MAYSEHDDDDFYRAQDEYDDDNGSAFEDENIDSRLIKQR